ncbi:glyceraldehyde 3-phosphate dehydrogenase NAD-binding domain-containing protein, partial [Aeromonas dhakensis]
MIKIAINGYGRIGRNVLRALYESGRDKNIKIVAINELAAPEAMVHLTRFDTSHGRFHHPVQLAGNSMLVGEDLISLFAERDPSRLPWRALGVDVVLDCTGVFGSRADAELHL